MYKKPLHNDEILLDGNIVALINDESNSLLDILELVENEQYDDDKTDIVRKFNDIRGTGYRVVSLLGKGDAAHISQLKGKFSYLIPKEITELYKHTTIGIVNEYLRVYDFQAFMAAAASSIESMAGKLRIATAVIELQHQRGVIKQKRYSWVIYQVQIQFKTTRVVVKTDCSIPEIIDAPPYDHMSTADFPTAKSAAEFAERVIALDPSAYIRVWCFAENLEPVQCYYYAEPDPEEMSTDEAINKTEVLNE